MTKTRLAAVVGSFYPNDKAELQKEVQGYLELSHAETKKKPRILIVPHAGYYYSAEIAASAFIEVKGFDYTHVYLIGPSHHHHFVGAIRDEVDQWETPLGSCHLAQDDKLHFTKNEFYHQGEHSLEVQLPFIQELLPEAKICPILVSGGMGEAKSIAEKLTHLGKNSLIIISSDFNHVGPRFDFEPDKLGLGSGEELDLKAAKIITTGDTAAFRSFVSQYDLTICGALPILIAMHLRHQWGLEKFTLKNYSNSGRKTGGNHSVGYAAFYL